MYRVLIVDPSDTFVKDIDKQIKDDFLTRTYTEGHNFFAHYKAFEPDILVLNLMTPGLDGIAVLRTLRDTGSDTAVIVLTCLAADYVLAQLTALNVKYVLTKPCTANLAVSHIRQLAALLMQPDVKPWCLENEVEWMLLNLGFCMGKPKFHILCQAILYKYKKGTCSITKEIYPWVARCWGSNAGQVEKAIRTAITEAYARGDQSVWQMYFTSLQKCPTNEEFISRIAGSLVQKARLRKPFTPDQEKAE